MRETYKSEDRHFNIKPKKLFEIIADLSTYIHEQNVYHGRTCGMLCGSERSLDVTTAVVNERGIMTAPFSLAKLTIGEDGSLDLLIYAHKKSLMDPEELYNIGKRYKVNK